VIDEALRCKERNEEKVILFLMCGHGHFDMKAYDDFLAGKLESSALTSGKIARSLESLRSLYPWINRRG
jgi:tryptophan synthase beta chain